MELDLVTVERIERFIVFESKVELLHWEDTSQWGFKIKLALASRGELDSFDKTMKRSKKRGGQRYHCILYGEFNRQFEAQFCGRGWAESVGAHVALHVPDLDDQLYFRESKTRDQGEKEIPGRVFDIMLMEVGDDEQIIDQTARERAERPVGGPRSKAVAMMLQDLDFNRWLSCHSIYRRPAARPDDPAACYTFEDADAIMKNVCGIESKVEFDNGNEAAWKIWETQFKAPFIRYLGPRA